MKTKTTAVQFGLREANQQFARLIRLVREGREIVLTSRGKPLARVLPAPPATGGADAAIDSLVEMGMICAARRHGPLPTFKPVALKGASIVATLREERDRG